jgi:hypothetical protein
VPECSVFLFVLSWDEGPSPRHSFFERGHEGPPLVGCFVEVVPSPPLGGGGVRGGIFSLIAASRRGVRGSGPGGGWAPGLYR